MSIKPCNKGCNFELATLENLKSELVTCIEVVDSLINEYNKFWGK